MRSFFDTLPSNNLTAVPGMYDEEAKDEVSFKITAICIHSVSQPSTLC